jgi:hypothetical protein
LLFLDYEDYEKPAMNAFWLEVHAWKNSFLKGTVQRELRWVKMGINRTARQVSFTMPQGTPSREELKRNWRLQYFYSGFKRTDVQKRG